MNKKVISATLIALFAQLASVQVCWSETVASIPPVAPVVSPVGSATTLVIIGTTPEATLDRSANQPPTPLGVSIKQPAQPDGGKDLVRITKGKPELPKFALTLSGGGARGAAHIGVLKKFEAEGLHPDFIAGSSIGATIGALYAAGIPISQIERMALDGSLKKAYFPIPFELKALIYAPQYVFLKAIGRKPIPGIYTGKSISRFISKTLPPKMQNIEDLPIRFSAISVNLMDSKPFWISKGNVAQAVRASSSIPGLYRPVFTGQRLLMDGGMRQNLPAAVGKAAGVPVVVGVRLHSVLESQPKERYSDLMQLGERLVSIYLAEMETKAMGDADIVIAPDLEEVGIEEFDAKHAAHAILEGEQAAAKAIPRIKELLRLEQTTASREAPQG